ncbi:hypothetical protein JOC77_001042 [Peribacillus deserti]|uniref:Uncharacterized protein n=1 Tax=Peribacillus deserti TaxID=673318 RepID=A0ABS2QF26_9BACI|nr:hypothetical protein [Peribacillus deserti]MBM7691635.1 hypothetical protein [Peribacillus deserti]
MRYFIVYVTFIDNRTENFWFKSKSGSLLLSQLSKYPKGIIATNKFSFSTNNALSVFILEVDLLIQPQLSKNDFAILNENACYNYFDMDHY